MKRTHGRRGGKKAKLQVTTRRLNLGNACYRSVQNLLSSRLLSKDIKIRIYKNYNFACGSVWVQNLVSDIKGETQAKGV
jgi:hypothetical protein